MKFGKKYDCITKTIQYDWYPYNKIKLEIENNTIKEIKFVENIVSTLKDLDQKYSKLVSLPINQSYAIFFEFTVILKLTLVAIYKICKKYDRVFETNLNQEVFRHVINLNCLQSNVDKNWTCLRDVHDTLMKSLREQDHMFTYTNSLQMLKLTQSCSNQHHYDFFICF